MKTVKVLVGVLFLFCANQAYAAKQFKMDAFIDLPAGGMVLAQYGNELFIVSKNGRFVIRGGTITDMWNKGVEITSLQQGKDLAQRININDMDIDLDELFSFKFGDPNKPRSVVFIDPESSASRTLLNKLVKVKSHNFTVLIAPLMGKKSAITAKKLACLHEKDKEAAKKLLLSGEYSFLPQKQNCGMLKMQKTLITSTIMGVDVVPFMIAPDGRVSKGVPKNVERFLRGK